MRKYNVLVVAAVPFVCMWDASIALHCYDVIFNISSFYDFIFILTNACISFRHLLKWIIVLNLILIIITISIYLPENSTADFII